MLDLMPERLKAGEFSSQEISICGKSFIADMSGALFWPSRGIVFAADLVIATSTAAGNRRSPGLGFAAEDALARLASVIDSYDAESVIILGNGLRYDDSCVDLSNGAPCGIVIDDDVRKTLAIMQRHCDWTWVTSAGMGAEFERHLGGTVVREYRADGLTFRDQPTSGIATHEIAGGARPAATASRHGHIITRPCFVGNGLRLVIPAFASIAGGRNVLGDEFAPLFGASRLDVRMLGHEGLCPVAPRLLKLDGTQ